MVTRTLLEIASEVCDRYTEKEPSTLFGTNDKIARILRVAAKDTIRELQNAAGRNGLSGYRSQWVFATRPGVAAYDLPPDFLAMIPGTEFRSRWPLGLIGPVSPQGWASWIAGAATRASPMGWQVKNGRIWLDPQPSTIEVVVIDYISSFMVVRNATAADVQPIDGFLSPISPIVPRDGYIETDALSYVEVSGASVWGTAEWGTAIWGTTPYDELIRTPAVLSSTKYPAYQVRIQEFANDTDTIALDDDHVFSLGLSWRLLRGMHKPYADARDEFNAEAGVFVSRDASRGRDIHLGTHQTAEVAPLGDGKWLVA